MEFFFEGRNECKNFWKKCVENHGFFRCSVVKRVVRQKTRVLSRGSSFRYVNLRCKKCFFFVANKRNVININLTQFLDIISWLLGIAEKLRNKSWNLYGIITWRGKRFKGKFDHRCKMSFYDWTNLLMISN